MDSDLGNFNFDLFTEDSAFDFTGGGTNTNGSLGGNASSKDLKDNEALLAEPSSDFFSSLFMGGGDEGSDSMTTAAMMMMPHTNPSGGGEADAALTTTDFNFDFGMLESDTTPSATSATARLTEEPTPSATVSTHRGKKTSSQKQNFTNSQTAGAAKDHGAEAARREEPNVSPRSIASPSTHPPTGSHDRQKSASSAGGGTMNLAMPPPPAGTILPTPSAAAAVATPAVPARALQGAGDASRRVSPQSTASAAAPSDPHPGQQGGPALATAPAPPAPAATATDAPSPSDELADEHRRLLHEARVLLDANEEEEERAKDAGGSTAKGDDGDAQFASLAAQLTRQMTDIRSSAHEELAALQYRTTEVMRLLGDPLPVLGSALAQHYRERRRRRPGNSQEVTDENEKENEEMEDSGDEDGGDYSELVDLPLPQLIPLIIPVLADLLND